MVSSDTKHVIRNVAFPAAEFTWSALLTLVSIPVIVHELGVDIYGVWLVCMSVAGLLSAIFDPGVGPASIKYLSEPGTQADPDAVSAIVGTTALINLAVGSTVGLMLWVSGDFFVQSLLKLPVDVQADAQILLLASGVILIINFVGNAYSSVLQACQRFDLFSGWSIIISTASTAVTIVLLYANVGVWALPIGAVISSTARLVVQAYVACSLLPSSAPWRLRIRPGEFRQVITYGGVFFLFTTLDSVFWQAQRFLIGSLLGPAAVSYFSVPQSATQRLHGLINKASSVLFPLISALSSMGDLNVVQRLYTISATIGALVSFGVALPLVPLAPAVMRTWMGNEFAFNSSQVLSALALAYLLLSITVVPSQYLFGAGLARTGLIFLAIEVAVYFPLALFFAPRWGVQGAALALLGAYLCVIPSAIFYIEQRLLRIGWRNTLRIYLPPLVGALLCIWCLHVIDLSTVTGNLFWLLLVYSASVVMIVASGLLVGGLMGNDLLSCGINVLSAARSGKGNE